MKNKKLEKFYIDSRSLSFWWGIFGWVDFMSREDFIIYDENKKKIDWFCAEGERYLKYCYEEFDENDKMKLRLKKFFDGKLSKYQYFYDKKWEENFFETPFLAPKNRNGIKPSNINMWCKVDFFDLENSIKVCKIFIEKHLKIKNPEVKFLRIPRKKRLLKEFLEILENEKDTEIKENLKKDILKYFGKDKVEEFLI